MYLHQLKVRLSSPAHNLRVNRSFMLSTSTQKFSFRVLLSCINMPFKRPASTRSPSSGLSSASDSKEEIANPPKRSKVSKSPKALPNVKVYIIQAKLSPQQVVKLSALAEKHCAKLCMDVDEADVVVTAISMRRRLERHMSWDVATSKAIVTPEWLTDSVKASHALPCEDYVAVDDLRASTLKNCPDCNKSPCQCDDTDYGTPRSPVVYPSPPSSPSASTKQKILSRDKLPLKDLAEPAAASSVSIPAHLLPPPDPIPTNLEQLSYLSKYACQRASPLICPNQELAVELDILKRSRGLEGEERSALSYARAISVVKAYPHRITSKSQVQKLPHFGVKICSLVEEFLDTGEISEARSIASSERFKTLSDFSSVYGIGPNAAQKLYNLGLRTLEDLEIYYGVDPTDIETNLIKLENEEAPRGSTRRSQGQKDEPGESWIKVALGLRNDLMKKIPRTEAEEMSRIVMQELDAIEPGCVSTIVGGFRRGKPEGNDVDIVFTHPDGGMVKGLCRQLVQRLHERGMVTHVMHLSSFHGPNPLRTAHWDSLEKALTVFTLPKSSPLYTGTRRRLDLIFAHPDVYWTAVIGWSGSVMFQRDLRQWAKDKYGMKFDSSGITRRHDSKPFYPKTEKEVFELFGLEWVGPTWRNADV
ncbi:unnamed protein product [Somion occarium]